MAARLDGTFYVWCRHSILVLDGSMVTGTYGGCVHSQVRRHIHRLLNGQQP